MKSVTVENYQEDKYYLKVVNAFGVILDKKSIVCPVDVFLAIGNLTPLNHQKWVNGEVPYLERVIHGNLSKFLRILKIIGFYAHDLDMIPVQPDYSPYKKGTKRALRYSKTGKGKIERLYVKSFKWNKKIAYEEFINTD